MRTSDLKVLEAGRPQTRGQKATRPVARDVSLRREVEGEFRRFGVVERTEEPLFLSQSLPTCTSVSEGSCRASGEMSRERR